MTMLNTKRNIKLILLLFLAVSFSLFIFKTFRAKRNVDAEKRENKQDANQELIVDPKSSVDIVYYFYTSQRCQSCLKIESYTREAITLGFKDKIDNKKLAFRMVNVEEPYNNHFVNDFGLYTKSVVLVKIRDGKQTEWKNLDQVWNLLGDKDGFISYIQNELKNFIEST